MTIVKIIWSYISKYILFIKFKIIGKENSIKILGNALFYKSIFKIKGRNNYFKFNSCSIKELNLIINGNNNTVVIDRNVRFYEGGKILIEGDNCYFKICENTTIGKADFLMGENSNRIVIGENCMLSRDISINTSDFHSIIDVYTNSRINPAKDVLIGNHVWIGNGVYVNKGAIISTNSVIAAKSVVPGKFFEENTIIGGIPAKVIKKGVNWNRMLL